jgi:xylulokinase
MKSVLGIDLGTQSLKLVFYDYRTRRVAAAASAPLDLHQDDDGAAEQQADWWLTALHAALREVGDDVRRSVQAIAVSGQQHGFVPVAASGDVLAPVKLWCDTSTVSECDEIMAAYGGPQKCLDEVGNLILPGYTASKIRWLAKADPQTYGRMHTVLLPHDYLNFYLTGERGMEAGDASGTGFLDIRRREWSAEMLAAIDSERDLSRCLPPLRRGIETIGLVHAAAARSTGLPAGVPVATGGGDNMMGAIGTGNVSPGKVTMSLGTSGTVYAHADQPIIDPRGEIAAFCSSTGGWLPLMCTMNCTVTTELMRGVLNADIAAFEQAVGSAPRGAGGIVTLPFFNGERTPNLPRAKACIVGLDSHNMRRENLLRAALEGATFALRYGVERLCELGIDASGILLTGGGVGSPTWRQAVADICDAPVSVLQQDEGAGFGAALQALAVLDGVGQGELQAFVDDHLALDADLSCDPDPEGVDFYDTVYADYRDAVDAVTPLYR